MYADMINLTSNVTDNKRACMATGEAYIAAISELKVQLAEANEITEEMAESLSRIDPNMENGEEGEALVNLLYEMSDEKPSKKKATMPETPENCIGLVAGKVLMIETLQERLNKAVSFRDFFAQTYCSAYVNSLVTMEDARSQIFPGAFDSSIDDELQRIFGVTDKDQLVWNEFTATTSYLHDVEAGLWKVDESTLLPAVEPVEGALSLCSQTITDEVKDKK